MMHVSHFFDNDITECPCVWPNGERRVVVVMAIEGDMARIIWNERVDTDCTVVTGMEELVPLAWLQNEEPSAAEEN